jgi:cytochrome P450
MLRLDPPDHKRLRALVSKAFTPRAVEALGSHIEAIVHQLFDQLDSDQPFDLITELAHPLPVIVIAEMIGIPASDRDRFRIWSDAVAGGAEPQRSLEQSSKNEEARRQLMRYFDEAIDSRPKEARGDLISDLKAAEESGDRLSHDELLATLILLLVAGNETTRNLIGNGLLALLRHPEQMQHLWENPAMLDGAIDEMLRFDSPVQIDRRIALVDVEIGGRHIEKGQLLLLMIGAANRDPAAFPEPDRLDIGRGVASHIAFGRGIHFCLGAPLARLEAQIVFRTLIERCARVHLAGEPKFRRQVVLRGLQSLPVSIEPRRVGQGGTLVG